MARMTPDEWRKKKEEQKKQGTISSPATTSAPSNTKTSDGSSGRMSPSEWKAKKSGTSFDYWAKSSVSLLNEIQEKAKSWSYKDEHSSYSSRISTLLSQADNWRNQYAGNEETISYIDTVVSALSDTKRNSFYEADNYSQWETQEDYDFWESRNTTEKRQQLYTDNQSRIEELESFYDEAYTVETWYNSYRMNPDAWDAETVNRNMTLYNKLKNEYGSLSNLEAEIDRLKTDNLNYKRGNYNEKGQHYGSKVVDDYHNVTQNADFDTGSANRDHGNPTREELTEYDALTDSSTWHYDENNILRDAYGNEIVKDSSGFLVNPKAPEYTVKDRLGIYLSATAKEREEYAGTIVSGTWGNIIGDGNDGSWDQLYKEEIDIYYYLLNTSGQEAAEKYLSDMKTELNRRETMKASANYVKEYSEANFLEKIGLNAATIPAQLISGVAGTIENAAMTIRGEDINPYSSAHSGSHFSQTVRSETAKDINSNNGGNIWLLTDLIGFTKGDAYQAGMSILDSFAAIGIGGKVGGALLASSAASSEATRLYEQGASMGQIAVASLAAGAAEMVFESLSIDKLINLKDAKTAGQFVKNILVQGGIEATEEGFTEIANILTNAIVMGNESDWTKLIEENDGSVWEAFKAEVKAVAHASFAGFLSGVGSATIPSAVSYGETQAQYAKTGEEISDSVGGVDALKALANEVAGVSDAKMQKSINKQIASLEKKASNRKAGKLYEAVGNSINAQNKADIVTILEMNKFSSEEANSIADAIVALASGEQLTRQQEKTLYEYKDSTHVKDIINNYNYDDSHSIGKRNKALAEFENGVAISLKAKEYTDKAFTPEGKYKVSDTGEATALVTEVDVDGKTITKDTGEVIDIKGIKKIDRDKMILDIGDGKTIDAKNVAYASKKDALIYEAIANLGDNIDPATANKLIDKFDGGNAMVFARGITQAYTYGFYGLDRSEMKGKHTLSAGLTEEQRNYAYGLGEQYRPVKDAKDKTEAKVTKAPGEKGVYYRDKNGNATDIRTYLEKTKIGLKDVQKTAIEAMEKMSEMMGVRFNVFESWVENGKRYYLDENGDKVEGSPNGFYDTATGEIYIDLNAGNDYQGTMLFTVAHELTHFMRQWSPEHFTKIAHIVFQHGGMKGSVAKLAARKQAIAKAKGKPISYDTALEEVVADGMETILKDGKVMEFMEDVKKTDHEAWAKLKEWFKKLADFLKELVEAYSSHSAQTVEGAKVAEFSKDLLLQIEQIWAEGAVAAGDTYQGAVTEAADTLQEELAESGIGFDGETKTVFALRDSTAYKDILTVGRNKFDTEAIAQLVSKGTGRSIADARKWVKSEMALANIIMANPEFLDFDPDDRYEAIKKNSDYPQGTVDLSNLCPKREEFTSMFDMLQKKYPNKLFTAQDVAEMRKILSNAGITVACGACFVEDRRQLVGEIADTYINMWKEAVETGKPLQKTNAAGVKSDLLVTKALAKQYGLTAGSKIMATDTYIPNQYDLTTYEGFKLLEKNHPTIAMGFNRYNNSRGQQSARLIEGRAEYKRQILGWSDAKVRSVNNNGGLRIFSFSDFEVVHLLDLVQVIIDCSARGVKIQGYTKIPAFARLVRSTGIKLNRSHIPKGDYGYHMENGKVVLDCDTTEGIDTNDENFIDEDDNPDVGDVIIGINPTQIAAAMLDSFFDYIIPFHSNKAKEILRKLGTGEWFNYKESQHEKDIATGTSSKHNVNIYTEVINKYHPTNKVEFVEAFLKECKRQGKIPRYAEFLNKEYKADGAYQDEGGSFDYTYREGFHKLLVDFKMFDKDGNMLPQGNITPNLDDGFMAEMLSAEVDKKQSYEFPQEVYDAIDDRFGEQSAKLSDRDSDKSTLATEGTVKYSDNRFFPGNVFPSGLTHTSVAEWANRKDVKTGDKRLVLHRGIFYRVEKFDDMDFKYLITKKFDAQDYKEELKEYGEIDSEEPVQSGFDKIVTRSGATIEHGQGGHYADPSGAEYGSEDNSVRQVDADEDGWRENSGQAERDRQGGLRDQRQTGRESLEWTPQELYDKMLELDRELVHATGSYATKLKNQRERYASMIDDMKGWDQVRYSDRDSLTPDQQKHFDYNQKQKAVGSALKTLKGSSIKRSTKYGVGKEIGGEIYFHKDYAEDILPDEVLSQALQLLEEEHPGFEYNCLKYNPKTGVVAFQEAPDFDSAREPVVGDYVSANTDTGVVKTGHSNYIWHHKWNWVKNDYSGFDVAESWNWSKAWLSTLTEVSDGNGIERWNAQLDKFGLPHDGALLSDREQEYDSKDTSVKILPATFTKFGLKATDRVLDWGGGQYDIAKKAIEHGYPGIKFEVVDAFNRTPTHNDRILAEYAENPATVLTINNVLNVIKETEIIEDVIRESKEYLSEDGVCYIKIYEGNDVDGKTGNGKVTSSGWQNNQPAEWYRQFAEKYYQYVERSGDILIASDKPIDRKGLPKASKEATESMRGKVKEIAKSEPSMRASLYSDRILMGSLFSGGGTLEAGLAYQMLDKQFGVEYDGKIASVYADNHGDHIQVGRVEDFDISKYDDIFYLHASPVCHNFSAAKHGAKELQMDIDSAKATAKHLETAMPQVFTVENAPGYRKSESLKIITDKLTELGYKWDVDVYNSADYGSATSRNRVILRAVKDGELPAKPAKQERTNSWDKVTRDLWGTLPKATLRPSFISAIENTRNLPILDANGKVNVNKPLLILTTTSGHMVTFCWEGDICPTLTTKCGEARLVMPDGNIYGVTPEFMGRIQGLPDDYKYPNEKTRAFTIIGNGIPTHLTKAVVGGVLDSAYEQTHEGKVLYQDRDEGSVSNRSLLANAFEGLAKDDTERNKIQEYKSKIALIETEEKKLRELNEQIKELSFAKGPRDTKKINALRFDANQAANRINTYDKQLLRLEASKPLQDVLAREKKRAYAKAEQEGKKSLAKQREKAAKTQRALLEKWQESRKKGIENREKTAMRHKIQSVVGELNQLLLSNDKKRHVPDSLKKAVADALALVNMDTVGAEERAAKYAALIAKETDPDKIDAYTVTMENILRQGEKMGQRLKELRDAYEEIQNSDDPDIANAYDPVIAENLKELAGSIGNTSLRDMSVEQLQDVYNMYKMVLTKVRDANKSFIKGRAETISNLASRVVGEVKRVGGEHKYRAAILDFVKKFGWDNMKPVYAFEHIGSGTLTDVFNSVRAGEDVWAVDVTEAREYYLGKSKKYGYDSWDFKKKYSFKSTSELDFELTLEQILSLYAYSKREQAHDHLRLGGFVFDSNIETYKEKGSNLIKYKVNTADAHQITPEILANIIGNLTEEQKAFVDEMQNYLSTVMGAKGNEVTMEMYGVKLFKEKFYFPLKSAKQFMFEQNEVSGEVRIKNSCFTNKVVAKANNPVILNNFMDVWAGHVNDMSMYHAFVLPLEDFNRVFNYNSPKQEGQPPVSVKGTIQNAYGPSAVGYVRQLITDLNGGARSDSTTGFINKMIGLFKKGSVFASLSVVVQQPSAIARAAALVDTKYFIGPKVDHKRHKALWDEVKQYAPVAIIKEMGYFDTNMGKSTQDFILSKEYNGFTDKMKALVTDSNYRDEILSRAPALADEIAWCGIWEAVKRETNANNPGMDVKSEAFLKKAGERFTEVVTKTQVYDSVLSRSGLMRSKDTGMKMATAFMAEPTTSINMVADALLQGKRGNRKYARAAIGAVIASQILNSILVSFVYAGRDDDEDETYWEKYIGTLSGEMLDGLNPAGYIPFIKDIMSIVQGYDVERSDMAVVSDLWKAIENLSNDKVSAYRKVEGFAGSIAQIFGLPVKNIMRDARGIYQTVMSFVNGQQTTAAGIGYAIKGAITGKDVTDQQQLYEAYLSGDATQLARVKGRFKDQNAIDNALRKALRENDPRIKEAALAHYNGNPSERVRIAKLIIADGFDQDDVVAAINAEINAMKPEEAKSEPKKKGFYTTEDFAREIANGDQATANAAKTDIISTAQKNGKTEEEATDSFKSSAKTELKKLYLSGNISDDKVVDALISYCDMDETEAELLVESYEWEKQGYESATPAAVQDYNTHCATVSVPKDVYLYIRSFANNTKNDKDASGKTINYSAMKKVIAEINAQTGLTPAQKTAIARSLGWAEKNIQKYKTW